MNLKELGIIPPMLPEDYDFWREIEKGLDMSPMFVKIFDCDCGQRYRLEVSPAGFRCLGGRRRADDGTWIRAGGRGIEPGPRKFPVDYTLGLDKGSDGDGDVVHYGPPQEARTEEISVDCSHSGNYTPRLRGLPKRPYGTEKLEGLLAEWHKLHCLFVVALRELVETMNNDPRNDD